MTHPIAHPLAAAIALAALVLISGCRPGSASAPETAAAVAAEPISATENAAINQRAGLRQDVLLSDAAEARAAEDGPDDPTTSADPSGDLTPVQESGERDAQAALPQSHDRQWSLLRTTHIGLDKDGYYTATHPAPVRALAGREMTISGFMVPLEASDTTRHFLISPYTPVCFFCPPGEPNEVIEVHTARPVRSGYSLVRITGRFGLANNADKGLFFTLDDSSATVIRQVDAG